VKRSGFFDQLWK